MTKPLYEIPQRSKIYGECSDGSEYIIFDHIDGMYSYCETEKGAILHLSASAPLKPFKDGYTLAPDNND